MQYAIDASALLAFLNKESGSESVEKYFDSGFISAVNLSEVIGKLLDHGVSNKEADVILTLLPLDVVSFDLEQASLAAKIKKKTSRFGLSLGDRACLALAVKKKATAITADKAWKNLSLGINVKLVR